MSKIIEHSYGIKEQPSDIEINRRIFASAKNKETMEAVNESLRSVEMIDSREKDQEFLRRRHMDYVSERAANRYSSGSLVLEGQTMLFKYILTEAFKDALILDDYAVQEHAARFESLVDQYVDANHGYSMLERAIERNPINILKAIKEACDTCAMDTAKRIAREARSNKGTALAEKPIFEMNEEERTTFEGKRSELSLDAVSKLVKDKVVEVVRKERDRQKEEKEIEEDLKQVTSESTEEKDTDSSDTTSSKPSDSVKESTLFDSIMTKSYRDSLQSIKENLSFMRDEEGLDDNDDGDDEFGQDTAFPGSADNHLGTEDFTNPLQNDVDLELIMAEALTYYTLMEMTHTICLETFTRDELMNMSQQMLRN